ncbi:MAG: hypothetical protein M1819_001805 [Sarea resinae]|nr:MAG: hypothetical protein M1819_001805 [Sarea resinae]
MSFNTFFGNTTNSVKCFEIRLEQNVITLRGNGEEAASALLRGTVVLSLAEALTVKNIHLRLTGSSRIAWAADLTHPSASGRYIKQESIFYKHDWMLLEPGKRKSEILPPGSYAYPFELVIPGSTPESVEGLDDSWIVYRMKATIERGLLAPNVHARGHLRIVRTLDPSALELAHAMSVENIWPNKVEYCISTPSKAVIFGTSISVDMRLVPLLKGLKIGKISLVLCEIQDLSTTERSHKVTRDIVSHQTEIDENHQQTIDEEGQEGWTAEVAIQLPTSLRECVQDVNCKGFKIRHKLKFNVQLLNPDGHISEVRGILPIMIFISPNLPLGVANRIPPGEDAMEFLQQHAPPLYGEHQYDPLYSDIDPSGYMTPVGGTSGVTTPFYSRSQNTSSENVASLDAVAQGPASAQLLQSRLNSLRDAGTSRFTRNRNGMLESNPNTPPLTEDDPNHSRLSSNHDYFSIPRGTGTSSRQSTSNPLSRQMSHETQSPGAHTPEHVEYDQAQLSKVPSYSTAVRSPARIISYDNDNLPNYETAMSQPPSPGLAGPMIPALHLPSRSPSEGGSSGSEERPSTTEPMQQESHRNPLQATGPVLDLDESKFRLVQARGAL